MLWKERDELLRDGLPECSSWNKHKRASEQLFTEFTVKLRKSTKRLKKDKYTC